MTSDLGFLASKLPLAGVVRSAADEAGAGSGRLTLALNGDVMTGRGIDQVLLHPSDPRLYEPGMKSAEGYADIAEAAHGPIPRGADCGSVWGDALDALAERSPDALIINLETAVTTHDQPAPKGINYRMHPRNLPVLEAVNVDCCVLDNNHALDWRTAGLRESLDALESAGIAIVGAGRDLAAAAAPAVLGPTGASRVLVFAFGTPSSGIRPDWAAGPDQPSINFLATFPAAPWTRSLGISGRRAPPATSSSSRSTGGRTGVTRSPTHRSTSPTT